MPAGLFKKGSVGVFSRSGTLTYEAAFKTTNIGPGQTTLVGISGEPVNGTNFKDVPEFVPDWLPNHVDHHDRRQCGKRNRTVPQGRSGARLKSRAGFNPGRTAHSRGRMGRAGDRLGWPARRLRQDRGDGRRRHPRISLAVAVRRNHERGAQESRLVTVIKGENDRGERPTVQESFDRSLMRRPRSLDVRNVSTNWMMCELRRG
ncbi:Succinate--CoA ligase (ADP-forming) (plasmid) [Sphingobium sp. EP60837]|nr:Succinate--CoA ligase (ADP-forming) [Sphingobium sp. EP60837]